ncbi:hypothetical protein VTL71DRAFT_11762 [Oculimacula yallundae]|uniref:Uncharacterized protein n=1 Tax=Oculimacula yallundae TaxID=86028 RepID=A0ABR4CRC9_9HELO
MAPSQKPNWEDLNNHALSTECRSRNISLKPGREYLKHELVSRIADHEYQKKKGATEFVSFTQSNDPDGRRAKDWVAERVALRLRVTTARSKSVIDYQGSLENIHRNLKEGAEVAFATELDNLSIEERGYLDMIDERVQNADLWGEDENGEQLEDDAVDVPGLGPEDTSEESIELDNSTAVEEDCANIIEKRAEVANVRGEGGNSHQAADNSEVITGWRRRELEKLCKPYMEVGTEGADTEGGDTEGADTEGADTEGADTEGGDTEVSDTEGSDTDGDDMEGGNTEGGDTEVEDETAGDKDSYFLLPGSFLRNARANFLKQKAFEEAISEDESDTEKSKPEPHDPSVPVLTMDYPSTSNKGMLRLEKGIDSCLPVLREHGVMFLTMKFRVLADSYFGPPDLQKYVREFANQKIESFRAFGMMYDKSAIHVLFANSRQGLLDMELCHKFVLAQLYKDYESKTYCQEIKSVKHHQGDFREDSGECSFDVTEAFRGKMFFFVSSETGEIETSEDLDEEMGGTEVPVYVNDTDEDAGNESEQSEEL